MESKPKYSFSLLAILTAPFVLIGCGMLPSADIELASSVPGCDSNGGGTVNNPHCDEEESNYLAWLREFTYESSGSSNNQAYAAAVDSESNIITVGNAMGSFYGGTPALNAPDAFVMKYDKDGQRIWSRQFGVAGDDINTAFDTATIVVVDPSDHIFVSGSTAGSLDGTTAGENDIVLRKYDNDGNLLFAKQYGSAGSESPSGVALDSSGNIYIVGNTNGILAPAPTSIYSDGYIMKLDSAGSVLWKKQFSSQTTDAYMGGVGVDSSDNVIFGGRLGLFKYDSSGNQLWHIPGQDVQGVAITSDDIVFASGRNILSKYDSSGAIVWTKTSTKLNEYFKVTVDSAGNAVTCGSLPRSNEITNGQWGAAISKFGADGNRLWSYAHGGDYFSCLGIAINNNNETFLSGRGPLNAGFVMKLNAQQE